MVQAVANKDLQWHGGDILLQLKGATTEALTSLAFAVEAEAKLNVTDNQQVDTGFMRNAIYTTSPDVSTYGNTPGSGYEFGANGYVYREQAREMSAAEGEILVVAAAEYSLDQELKQSFLLKAVNTLGTEQGFQKIVLPLVEKQQ